MNTEQLLCAYETDVQFPDVSGMEQLDMLRTRSLLEKQVELLTSEQRSRLQAADHVLRRDAARFQQAIADLPTWREHAQAPGSHWWWYLDVLVAVPAEPSALPEVVQV